MRIKGRVLANRPGHFVNTETARALKRNIKRDANRPSFVYDPTAEPVYDINRIRRTLPHRPPFLLVDRIFHIDETSVAGIKNVTMNEPFFVGHFPEEPVMPGVLTIEALAQAGAVAILSLEENKGKIAYFGGINKCKFKGKIVPGDKVRLETKIIRRKGPVGVGEAVASVDGKVVVSAELTFMVG